MIWHFAEIISKVFELLSKAKARFPRKASTMHGAFRKSSVTNRTNKAGRKREQKIGQTNHLSFLLAIPRPLFETQGRGSRELNKSHRGAKTGCKDKKGCKDKRGRFLGVVLCPHGPGIGGINMQQLFISIPSCSSPTSVIAHNRCLYPSILTLWWSPWSSQILCWLGKVIWRDETGS